MKNLITCLVVSVMSGVTFADTWTVDDDGKADFYNIQEAVDAASNGDEIIVMPGTYTSTQDGHVVNLLGKALTLRSSDPSNPDVVAATIIDGENTRRGLACFNEETSETIISGFTITNGFSVDFDYNGNGNIDGWEGNGGGMYNYQSDPTLENCTFDNNTANVYGGVYGFGSSGGGMHNYDSSPTITNCTFTSNRASNGAGGGILNSSNSSPTITNCTFENNKAEYGGGMYNVDSPTITNCTFENNKADEYAGEGHVPRGGGMYNCCSSSPTITNCTFENNTADYGLGGGIYNTSNSSPTLDGCTFTGNNGDFDGGGMYNSSSSSPTIINCTFTNNGAYWGEGGGMYNEDDSSPTLTDTTVCGNTPDQIYPINSWIDNGGNVVADECPIDCPADINGDGYVDVSDLLIIIDQWGSSNSTADLNEDGIVNVLDLLIVIGNWGECE